MSVGVASSSRLWRRWTSETSLCWCSVLLFNLFKVLGAPAVQRGDAEGVFQIVFIKLKLMFLQMPGTTVELVE